MKEEIEIVNKNNKTEEEIKKENIEETTIKEGPASVLEQEENEKTELEEEIKNEMKQEQAKTSDGLRSYTKVIAVVSVLLLMVAMIFSIIFALLNKTSDKIVEGVFIKGINVSGLTREEATNHLEEVFTEQLKKNIMLKHSDFETVITPEQMEMKFKLTEAIDLAYSIGRTGKVLKDNYDIVNAKLAKIEINPAYSYNDELLTNLTISTQESLPDIVKQSGYSVDGSNLIISKGQKGVAIEQELLKKQIVEACVDFRGKRSYS